MQREETINRWKGIVTSVWHAEDNISSEWLPRLKNAKGGSPEEIRKVADEYVTAVATEIIDHCRMTFEDED